MKDLVVPLAFIAVLTSMLLPLPPALLDFLIAGNLGIALLLLVSAFYITDSLKLSVLPTLLLVATLYRLSLNVASTRLILGSGEAGHVIEAFGSIVISGNLLVGIVVFLVITLIQFIVIAKGSERVAEVAARFTLDALPGKQMSIDADVRAGLIDFETARGRRQEMQTESKFYGALDGAMKFVKGDAIAGLIIAGVNIVGGLTMGLAIEGLDIGAALNKYTILTVGDGLVSQIPALLNALAAGIVVTRVGRGDGSTVAQEIMSQLGQVRAAKFIIAGFSVMLMFVPGMPIFPFMCLSLVLIGSATFFKGSEIARVPVHRFEPRKISLVEVQLSSRVATEILSLPDIKQSISKVRMEIFDSTGLLLLPPEFSLEDSLDEYFSIKVRGFVALKAVLNGDPTARLTQILDSFKNLVLLRKSELIDDILTRRLLDFFDKDCPELVSAVVPGSISVTQLTEILRGLTKENVNFRSLEMVLQGIAESPSKNDGARLLLEDVRVALGRQIVDPWIENESLDCAVLEPTLDLMFINAERGLKPIVTEAVAQIIEELSESDEIKVVLASKGARALLRDCLHLRDVEVAVVAHEEIPSDVNLNIIKSLEGEGEYASEKMLQSLAA